MNNFLIVLRKEYLTIVGKKSFIIMTFLSPILMILLGAIPALLGIFAKDTSDKEVIVVDQTGLYYDTIREGQAEGFRFVNGDGTDVTDYKSAALSSDSVYAVVVITRDLLEDPRAITIYSTSTIPPGLEDNLTASLTKKLRDDKIASYDIPELDRIIRDSKVTLHISTVQWSSDGEERAASASVGLITGQIFNFALYFFVIIYGSMVLESVRVEKKNRIMEILASSVKPTTLMSAKIVGIGLVGITQLLMWLLFFLLAFVLLQTIILSSVTFDLAQLRTAILAATDEGDAELANSLEALASIDYGKIIFCFLCYFVTSYISFAALYAASGAVTDEEEGVNQITLPITILLMFGFLFSLYSAKDPNSTISLVASFIPFMAPNVMMVRLPFDPPSWQVILSLLMMVGFMVLFVWFAAKIFRVGMLMYGKKPNLKDLWRWVRYE